MSRSATEAVLSHVLLSVSSARVVPSDSADVSCHLWKVLLTLNAAAFPQLQSRGCDIGCSLMPHQVPFKKKTLELVVFLGGLVQRWQTSGDI